MFVLFIHFKVVFICRSFVLILLIVSSITFLCVCYKVPDWLAVQPIIKFLPCPCRIVAGMWSQPIKSFKKKFHARNYSYQEISVCVPLCYFLYNFPLSIYISVSLYFSLLINAFVCVCVCVCMCVCVCRWINVW